MLGAGDGHRNLWADTATTGDPVGITEQSGHPMADVPCGTPGAVVEVTPVRPGWQITDLGL